MFDRTKIRLLRFVLPLLLTLKLFAQQAAMPDAAQHGTCAIILASTERMALIVDSRLTYMGTTRSCEVSHGQGCKAVLVRPDVLVAVTGIIDDPVNKNHWLVSDQTKKLILGLPATLEARDFDLFADEWFQILTNHYIVDKKSPPASDSILIIATRIHGRPYVLKVSYTYSAHVFKMHSRKLDISEYPQLMYAGSCHDNIGSLFLGRRAPAQVPLPWYLQSDLDQIAGRRTNVTSASELAELLRQMEDVFSKADKLENRCWIGPPYDVATWEKGDAGWTTHFKATCRPKGAER